jgi:hypothetical protein
MRDTVGPGQRDVILGHIPTRRSSGPWTIAYCSRTAAPLSEDELASLAIHADTRNRTLDIVGVLFVAGNRFLQVLEGERGAVQWLYDVVAEDSRHRRVTKLMDMPIQRRAFDGWSMRLICDADLHDASRAIVLRSLETAKVLDADERSGLSGLRDLRACPAVLARAVLGRAGRASHAGNVAQCEAR